MGMESQAVMVPAAGSASVPAVKSTAAPSVLPLLSAERGGEIPSFTGPHVKTPKQVSQENVSQGVFGPITASCLDQP